MGRAKEIIAKTISRQIADPFVRRVHYSGKVDTRTQLCIGFFLDNELHGVAQFSPSIDKRKSIGVVKGTKWNEFIELARLAFDDYLPKNAESRCLSLCMRLIKKNAPHIKFIISYADGTQCGDGTIYRASNFKLIGIKENKSMIMLPDGSVHCKIIFEPGFNPNGKTKQAVLYGKTGIKSSWTANKFLKDMGAKFIEGFQLKYIYFIHPKEIDNLTVPILPFSKIDEMGAGMYKGKKITVAERKNAVKAQEKCAEPSSSEVAFVTT